jgi:hypothetical protein
MNQIPRLKIANLPTPIEALPRLSAHLGGPRLFIKRDDLTGLALGGNKTRKLEFLVAEAQANGAKTLITAGALQSNHCRQTAAAAAKYGFECILVLSGQKPDAPTGNYLLDSLFGAKFVFVENRADRDRVLKRPSTRPGPMANARTWSRMAARIRPGLWATPSQYRNFSARAWRPIGWFSARPAAGLMPGLFWGRGHLDLTARCWG